MCQYKIYRRSYCRTHINQLSPPRVFQDYRDLRAYLIKTNAPAGAVNYDALKHPEYVAHFAIREVWRPILPQCSNPACLTSSTHDENANDGVHRKRNDDGIKEKVKCTCETIFIGNPREIISMDCPMCQFSVPEDRLTGRNRQRENLDVARERTVTPATYAQTRRQEATGSGSLQRAPSRRTAAAAPSKMKLGSLLKRHG